MTQEFWQKQINIQRKYISSVCLNLNLSKDRRDEILNSAASQLYYFQQQIKQINMSTVDKVKRFHEIFEHPIGDSPLHVEPRNTRSLRIKLLFEELQELAEAGDMIGTFQNLCVNFITTVSEKYGKIITDGDNVNKIEELDAITDIQYVLDGKKLTSGLYTVTDEAFDLVHENNMNKAHLSEEHIMETSNKINKNLRAVFRNDVWIAIDKNGKVIKPLDHKKVDLSSLIK